MRFLSELGCLHTVSVPGVLCYINREASYDLTYCSIS
jgi:hypothetical protein